MSEYREQPRYLNLIGIANGIHKQNPNITMRHSTQCTTTNLSPQPSLGKIIHYPSLLRRTIGFFVDSLLTTCLSGILVATFSYFKVLDGLTTWIENSHLFPATESAREVSLAISWVAIWFIHRICAEMTTGASLGKAIIDAKVTMLSGDRVNFRASCIRNAWALLTLSPLFVPNLDDSLWSIIFLLMGLSIIFSAQNRSIAEKLSGTVIVNSAG